MAPLAAAPVDDQEFVVASREHRTPVVVELELAPVAEPMSFLPGQYVLVGDADYRVPVRSYSIANAPDVAGRITLLVTTVPEGATSPWLAHEVPVGETLLVSGPYGSFVADPDSPTPILCVAGGSGVAPIRALAEEAVRRGVPVPFTVLFSGRTEADVIDRDRFTGWAREHENFTFARTLTREDGPPPVGRVPELLPQLQPDLSGHEVFVAGAPGLVSATVQTVRDLGVSPGRLHTEEFYAEPQPW
ncbi:FAD-binding oxidoreductase [Ornithinimicrobium cryptoxanthini]|uniref:FAD-binding oxidoreductase n=1 Tax=Ornithinimicrobium cryptoxanthini TaxID=2934161 RepID=UPI002118CDE2|nr:FAD-binding oxidoreductase [Ornithinimicrobium cryptoxanthini]